MSQITVRIESIPVGSLSNETFESMPDAKHRWNQLDTQRGTKLIPNSPMPGSRISSFAYIEMHIEILRFTRPRNMSCSLDTYFNHFYERRTLPFHDKIESTLAGRQQGRFITVASRETRNLPGRCTSSEGYANNLHHTLRRLTAPTWYICRLLNIWFTPHASPRKRFPRACNIVLSCCPMYIYNTKRK